MRVLIVDDHEIVRRGLAQILTENFSDLIIEHARNSQQASERLAQAPWDLMLLDINLPGRSGLDLLQEMKWRFPSVRVVVLSAYPEEDFALRALKLGAAGYLTKDSASDELIAATRKALAGGKYVTAFLAEKLVASLDGEIQSDPHEALSNREMEVLRLISAGKTIKEIAAQLALSDKTIATYRARISAKLGLGTNVELARYALQHGLSS